jgi:glycerol-3-phosphate acyltransferase PlsY
VDAPLSWALGAPVLAGLVVAAYLLGAVPFGLVVVRVARGRDVREVGSGNIGATNVARAAGKTLGALTLLLDAGKGALPVLAARLLGGTETEQALAGAASFLGHCFPAYLGFRGGKGIATGLGVVLALRPWVALVALAAWGLSFAVTRTSSLSSLVAVAVVGGVATWLSIPWPLMALLGSMLLVVLLKHLPNLRRLVKGRELKV